jgi:hypothetical protein
MSTTAISSEPSEPPLPRARGPFSAHVLAHLVRPVHPVPSRPVSARDALEGDDFQLALYILYELHYRGFAGVDEGWEWEPTMLALRRSLESAFEAALRCEVRTSQAATTSDFASQLEDAVKPAPEAPSLSRYMEEHGTRAQFQELAIHRSAYQLKEADPHTWAIPRLAGGPKAAMVRIQHDEYGAGTAAEMHASLFAATMRALGLDPAYGTYLDLIPGPTLATVNLISLFGLHRRYRGALAGHLAAFEMTSPEPMARYDAALARLKLGADARRFYEVHVEADPQHARIAATELAAGLARNEPALAADILFGARALIAVEACFADYVLRRWQTGRSSLLTWPSPATN